MIKINLVPAEILAKVHQRQQMLQAAAVGILVASVVIMASLSHLYKLNSLERQLTADNVKLDKLKVIVAKVEELRKTRDAVKARLDVVQNLLKGRTLYPVFMSSFAGTVPDGVRVKTLSTTGGGSTGGPIKLTISAESRSNEDIAGWIRKMEDSGQYTGVELGPVNAQTNPDGTVMNFTISSNYTP